MAQVELVMPKMGESIMEATILKWLKQPGDTIEVDEPVLEIATDKVDSEVPSPVAGTLLETRFNEGDVVPIDEVIALIGTEGETSVSASPATGASKPEPAAAPAPVAEPAPASEPAPVASSNGHAAPSPAPTPSPAPAPVPVAAGNGQAPTNAGARFYSPLVLNIARQEGIAMGELEAMPGSGKDGRVTKKDILAYVKSRGAAPAAAPVAAPAVPAAPTSAPRAAAPAAAPTAAPAASAPAASVGGNVEIIEMDRMRKLIADHMVKSKQTSPHVTSFVEADVTNMVEWRNRVKKAFQEKHGQKITFTPMIIEAIVRAIADFPMVNVSVDGDKIIRKKDINIGMAAALPSGNLIVPVIKHADRLNLVGLTAAVNDLASRARANQLKPNEIQDGTYTVTNVGTFGNVMGTPVINQPQVAIMAAGAIRKKPAVIETPQGDFIGIRHMMFLSHAYDHRVVDGFLGGSFVRRVADYLEAWDPERPI